jgi:hypothetical protein
MISVVTLISVGMCFVILTDNRESVNGKRFGGDVSNCCCGHCRGDLLPQSRGQQVDGITSGTKYIPISRQWSVLFHTPIVGSHTFDSDETSVAESNFSFDLSKSLSSRSITPLLLFQHPPHCVEVGPGTPSWGQRMDSDQ